jgi:rhomboid protease GluP
MNHYPPADPSSRDIVADFRNMVTRFPITYGLIGFTIIIFLFQWLTAMIFGNGVVCGSGDLICQIGVKDNQAIANGQIWRFVFTIFIKIYNLNILVNIYSLHAVGPSVEIFYGKERTIIVYLLSGITGIAFSLAFNPYPAAGASGAIFGMVGALALFLYRHRYLFGSVAKDQLTRIGVVVLLNLVLGFSAMIDNWGHVGGLLGGILIGWIIGPQWERAQTLEQPHRVIDTKPWKNLGTSTFIATGLVAFLCLAAIFSPFNR